MAAADDEAHLGGDGDGGDGRLVAGEGGARRRTLGRLTDDGLGARVPVPEEDGAVLAARRHVAVGRDVALGAAQARDDAEVAVDDLHDLGRVGGEDAEAVVPEAARHQEAAVHRRQEAVGAQPHLLAEVVAQVPPRQVPALARHRRCTVQHETRRMQHATNAHSDEASLSPVSPPSPGSLVLQHTLLGLPLTQGSNPF